MSYQEPKSTNYGVNTCDSCLEKQREIDRLKEEVQRLKQKLNLNQRKSQQGFFGSSTPSSQIPVKPNSLAEKQAKKGGGQLGHLGVGRQVFSVAQADEVRKAEVSEETCQTCQCRLSRQSSNRRAVYELEVERLRKVFYQIERKVCPKCRKTVSGKVGNVLPRMSLSNELVIEAAEQHYVLGRTLGQIAERFSINYATLAESLKRVGKMLEPSLENLESRLSEILCQTRGRNGLANGWSKWLQLVFWGQASEFAFIPRNQKCQCRQRSLRNKGT